LGLVVRSFMTKIANNQICPVCGKKVKLIEIESDPESGPRVELDVISSSML
jgi:hypothetical protein